MSSLNLKTPSINCKISGMYAKRINSEQIDELLKQSNTKQVIALLKSLNENLKDLEDNPERLKIKIFLDKMIVNDIKKIYKLLNQKEKKIFLEFISSYEIKCIKSVLRKLYSKSVINEDANEIEIWTDEVFKHLRGIENVQNYQSFIEFVDGTQYSSIFNEYETIENINIFEIENKLDKIYFENIFKISRKSNKALEDMVGKQIDLNNIIWIYRIKKYYKFDINQITKILINKNYKLKKSELIELVQAENIERIIDILNQTYYSKYIDFSEIDELESNIDRYLYKVYKSYFRANVFDIARIYAYMNMAEKENNDIINIVEGIRYNMSIEEIRKKLVKGI